ncbi:hypothetical protein AAE478_007980 [Parahypoxylon ruwenzoriense]
MKFHSLIPIATGAGGALVCHAVGISGLSRDVSTVSSRDNFLPPTEEVNSHGSYHVRMKRATPIQDGPGNADTHLWPGAVIRYCFASEDIKEKLFDDLMAARNLWYQQGLDERVFRFDEVSDTECRDNRANVLLISYSPVSESNLATTPGIPPVRPGFDGPIMVLTDNPNIGLLDVPANYAHELGHAWGLIHEHQNPYYWEQGNYPAGKAEAGKAVFGSMNFNCQNLMDYETAMSAVESRIRNQVDGQGESVYGADRQAICTSAAVARDYNFSAANYLPCRASVECAPTNTDASDVDWDSIMIYCSGAGAKGSASAPNVDDRLPILMHPGSGKIPRNLVPSQRDIKNLNDMYKRQAIRDGPLLGHVKNKQNNAFSRLKCKAKAKTDIAKCPLCDEPTPNGVLVEAGGIFLDIPTCDTIPVIDGNLYCTADDVSHREPDDADKAVLPRSKIWAWRPFGGIRTNSSNNHHGHLDKRATEKTIDWSYPPGTMPPWKVSFGSYPPCGEGATNSKIAKWFSEPQDNSDCTPTVTKITKKDRVSTTKDAWATEHVFEAQTVKQFWIWLATGTDTITDYQRPSYEWVTRILCDIPTQNIQAFTMTDYNFFYNNVPYSIQGAITHGFGSKDNPEELTLASWAINRSKLTWFSLGLPDYTRETSARSCRKLIRDGASVFEYLRWDAGTSANQRVWIKFMRVSNWIDTVFWKFDSLYPWGRYPNDEPRMTNNMQPSLRALFAYFLKNYLSTLESNAAAWGNNAITYYNQKYPPQTTSDKNWVEGASNGQNAWATGAQLRLPREAGAFDIWGCIANPEYMTDGKGDKISIGNPAIISSPSSKD